MLLCFDSEMGPALQVVDEVSCARVLMRPPCGRPDEAAMQNMQGIGFNKRL